MLRALPLLLLTACLTAVPQRVEIVLKQGQEDDEGRTGSLGDDGPFAVAHAQLDVQARVVDSFSTHVFFAWRNDALVPSDVPLLVLLQERGVSIDRYFWIAQHFASRGYPTVIVDHFADAPLVESDNGALALENIRRVSRFNGPMKELIPEDAKGVIIGHGEGGRAAQDLWVRYPTDFDRLLVLGAELTPGLSRADGWAACFGGSNDKRTAGMLEVCSAFPASDVAEVDPVCFGDVCVSFSTVTTASFIGINHYLFADDVLAVESQSDGALGDKDGPQSESPEVLRKNALSFIDAWLDAAVRGDAVAGRAIVQCPAITRCEVTNGCKTNAACAFPGVVVTP